MTDREAAADVEFSPLSQAFSEDGLAVEVMIRRPAGSDDGWTLEVLVDEDNAIVWDEPFATDREALEEFQDLVAEKGLREVVSPPEDDQADDA